MNWMMSWDDVMTCMHLHHATCMSMTCHAHVQHSEDRMKTSPKSEEVMSERKIEAGRT